MRVRAPRNLRVSGQTSAFNMIQEEGDLVLEWLFWSSKEPNDEAKEWNNEDQKNPKKFGHTRSG